jgi:histidinol-phosphate aminotransferase
MGLTVAPSQANFVMTVLPSEADAMRIFEELLGRGIVVRPLAAFGLPNCLRISTGLDEDNRLCIDALRKTYAASLGTTHAS